MLNVKSLGQIGPAIRRWLLGTTESERREIKIAKVASYLDLQGVETTVEERERALERFNWDVSASVAYLESMALAKAGVLLPIMENVPISGIENFNGTSCYIDSLLFAMFGCQDAFDALLQPRSLSHPLATRVQITCRVIVNQLRAGQSVARPTVRQLCEDLAACGWRGVRLSPPMTAMTHLAMSGRSFGGSSGGMTLLAASAPANATTTTTTTATTTSNNRVETIVKSDFDNTSSSSALSSTSSSAGSSSNATPSNSIPSSSSLSGPPFITTTQEDAGELFMFLTDLLELPYLPFQVRMLHTGRSDTDDNRLVTERLLQLAIPDNEDDKDKRMTHKLAAERKKSYRRNEKHNSNGNNNNNIYTSNSASWFGQRIINGIGGGESSNEPISLERLLTMHFFGTRVEGLRRRKLKQINQVPKVNMNSNEHDPSSAVNDIEEDNNGNTIETTMPLMPQLVEILRRSGSISSIIQLDAWSALSMLPFWSAENESGQRTAAQSAHFPDRRILLPMMLKRYRQTLTGRWIRSSRRVIVPEELDFTPFVTHTDTESSNGHRVQYRLTLQAVVCHRGASLDRGHYVAYCRQYISNSMMTSAITHSNSNSNSSESWQSARSSTLPHMSTPSSSLQSQHQQQQNKNDDIHNSNAHAKQQDGTSTSTNKKSMDVQRHDQLPSNNHSSSYPRNKKHTESSLSSPIVNSTCTSTLTERDSQWLRMDDTASETSRVRVMSTEAAFKEIDHDAYLLFYHLTPISMNESMPAVLPRRMQIGREHTI